MKFFSLQFLDKKTEIKFQTKKQEISKQLMKSHTAFLTVFLIILIIISAYENNWINLSFQVVSLIIIIISLRLNYRSKEKNYFQNSILIFVTFFNFYKSVDHLLNNPQGPHYYIEGYIYALTTISLINQASIIQKSLIIISIYLMLQIFKPNLQLALWNQIIQFAICLTFYIISIYKIEQIQRKEFIKQLKHQKALQQLVNFTGIQLYLVSYIREKNSLLLTMNNNEENISVQQQQQFILNIRSMKVLIKDQDSQTQCKSQEVIRQEATMNLEKFLFYFMTCPEKLKQQTKAFINDSMIKLQGILDTDNYNIQIVQLYDELPSAILLISQNKKDIFIEELKLRYKLHQQALETIEQTFSSNIKMSLVYFMAIEKLNKQKNQNLTKNQIIYRTIQSKIGRAYNDFQNLKDFFNLNTSFQRTIIQNFEIYSFLDGIINEIKHYYCQSKQLNFHINSKLKSNRVIQDQKQLKQLFLNLLYCISEHSQDISIFLEDNNGFQTKTNFIKVRFEYRGMFFSKDALKGLPFINPITISELRHNTQQAYQLNLPMAVVLIRKLGPSNKIYIKQSKNAINSLEFFIYRELTEDFHLMPLQSQHPLNYLITNTRSSVHGKHAAYFDLLSLSPRIQLDNFNEL